MDNNSECDVGPSATISEGTDAEKFSTPRNSGINPDQNSSITRGYPSATQSFSALETSPTMSPSPFSFDPSPNLAKKKQRNKKMDKSQPLERRTRSQSRPRPRSYKDIGPVKKKRNKNASDQELPDPPTANYISMLAYQVAMKINKNLTALAKKPTTS